MRSRFVFPILLILLMTAQAGAHPVAYQGALAVMGFNQPDLQNWQIAYSVTSRLAFGIDYLRESMLGTGRDFGYGRVNLLLKRWNGDFYQANIYLYGGAGASQSTGAAKLAGFVGGEADYETRKIYLSAKAMGLLVPDEKDMTMVTARIGVAPYVGEAGTLHAWLVAQAQYTPGAMQESLRIGPVLRFFYQNVLWELGVSARGSWLFNFMVHL